MKNLPKAQFQQFSSITAYSDDGEDEGDAIIEDIT